MKRNTIHKHIHKHRKKIYLYRHRYLIAILVLGGLLFYPVIHNSPKVNKVVSAKTQETENVDTQETSTENTQDSKAQETPKETDIIPGLNLTYGGEQYSIPASEVHKIVNGTRIDDNKYVFLTFDDGPSPNTEKVLNTLKEKGVHATFFILGSNLAKNVNVKK